MTVAIPDTRWHFYDSHNCRTTGDLFPKKFLSYLHNVVITQIKHESIEFPSSNAMNRNFHHTLENVFMAHLSQQIE